MKKLLWFSLMISICGLCLIGCGKKDNSVEQEDSTQTYVSTLPRDVNETNEEINENNIPNQSTDTQEVLQTIEGVPTVDYDNTERFMYENVEYDLTINETNHSYTDFVNFLPAITNETSSYNLTTPTHYFYNDDAKTILDKILTKFTPTCSLISFEGDLQESELYLCRTECQYIVLTHSVNRDLEQKKDYILQIEYTDDTFVKIPEESYMRELYNGIKAANPIALADVNSSELSKIIRLKPEIFDDSLSIIQVNGNDVILAYSDDTSWKSTMLGCNGSTLFSRDTGEKVGEVDGFYLLDELQTRFGMEIKGKDTLITEDNSTILIRRFDLDTTNRFYLVVRYLSTDEVQVKQWANDLVLGYRQ